MSQPCGSQRYAAPDEDGVRLTRQAAKDLADLLDELVDLVDPSKIDRAFACSLARNWSGSIRDRLGIPRTDR